VKRGIYAVCSLADWVEEGDLFVAAKGWRRPEDSDQETKHKISKDNNKGEWWEAAKIDDNAVFEFGSSTKGIKLDVSLVFGSRTEITAGEDGANTSQLSLAQDHDELQDIRSQPSSDPALMENSFAASQDVPTPPEEQDSGMPSLHLTSFDGEGNSNILEATQSPEELLDGLRHQYLEALYTSKVRVALTLSKIAETDRQEDIRCVLCKRSSDALSYCVSIVQR
jgi:hypothetical protein